MPRPAGLHECFDCGEQISQGEPCRCQPRATPLRIVTRSAVLIQQNLPMRGHAHLYRLDPEGAYVVVSAVTVPFGGPETYIFPADRDGHITSWLELEGSYKGGLDHAEALRGAGYTVDVIDVVAS